MALGRYTTGLHILCIDWIMGTGQACVRPYDRFPEVNMKKWPPWKLFYILIITTLYFPLYFYDNEILYILDENEYLHSFTEDFKLFECCHFCALFCYTDAWTYSPDPTRHYSTASYTSNIDFFLVESH